jgi:hypothetical protein
MKSWIDRWVFQIVPQLEPWINLTLRIINWLSNIVYVPGSQARIVFMEMVQSSRLVVVTMVFASCYLANVRKI